MTTKKTDNPKPPRKKAVPKSKKAISKAQAEKNNKAKEEALRLRINEILLMISDEGYSLRKALRINKMGNDTFFNWVDASEENRERYARACTQRADAIFEEMFDIADDNRGDTKTIFDRNGNEIEIEDKEWTSRVKLRLDVRKWAVSKLNPKKYGERIEVAGDKENPLQVTVFQLPDNKRD